MSKMAGVMRKSTEITKSMNALINAPAVMAQMRKMAAEMSKAGIVDDIIQVRARWLLVAAASVRAAPLESGGLWRAAGRATRIVRLR